MSKQKKFKKKSSFIDIPFGKRNYQIFGVAVLIITIGYWALSRPPVDGFLTLTVAPILLIIGYCVLIPLAIWYSDNKESKEHQ